MVSNQEGNGASIDMNVILIGAGRGQRLMPITESEPKSFTLVADKRILDWTVQAFKENGLDRFVFIGGYLIDSVRQEYPGFRMVENTGWRDNNILFSLMCARDHMTDGFYSAYTDTLFRADAVAALGSSPYDITLVVDTLWRDRYRHRSQHPESDGEKVTATGDRVTRVSRDISSDEASGEFTGLLRMTRRGASQFLAFHDSLYQRYGADGRDADGRPFRMAYLIHQLDLMVQAGIEIHCVGIPGGYHEIDTVEDFHLASEAWGVPGAAS